MESVAERTTDSPRNRVETSKTTLLTEATTAEGAIDGADWKTFQSSQPVVKQKGCGLQIVNGMF